MDVDAYVRRVVSYLVVCSRRLSWAHKHSASASSAPSVTSLALPLSTAQPLLDAVRAYVARSGTPADTAEFSQLALIEVLTVIADGRVLDGSDADTLKQRAAYMADIIKWTVDVVLVFGDRRCIVTTKQEEAHRVLCCDTIGIDSTVLPAELLSAANVISSAGKMSHEPGRHGASNPNNNLKVLTVVTKMLRKQATGS